MPKSAFESQGELLEEVILEATWSRNQAVGIGGGEREQLKQKQHHIYASDGGWTEKVLLALGLPLGKLRGGMNSRVGDPEKPNQRKTTEIF